MKKDSRVLSFFIPHPSSLIPVLRGYPGLGPSFLRLFGHAQHAQEEATEHRLHSQNQRREGPQGRPQGHLRIQRHQVLAPPLERQPQTQAHTREEEASYPLSNRFQIHIVEEPQRESIGRQQPTGPTVRLGETTQPHQLIADEHTHGPQHHRVHVKHHTAHRLRSRR